MLKLLLALVAETVPTITQEQRESWEIKDGTTMTQIKFNLPDLSDLFPIQNGEISSYQIYVLGQSSNEKYLKGKS